MLAVKSILSGEFTTTGSPGRLRGATTGSSMTKTQKQPRGTTYRNTHSHSVDCSELADSSIVDTTLPNASYTHVTSLKGESDGPDSTTEAFSCGGSTAPGDSFVLAIDWETTTAVKAGPSYYHDTAMGTVANHGLNESLEDPYLPPIESVRRRLRRKEQPPQTSPLRKVMEAQFNRAHNAAVWSVRKILSGSAFQPPKQSLKRLTSMDVVPKPSMKNSPTARSLGSFDMPHAGNQTPAKSLGSFEFPNVDFEISVQEDTVFDVNRPSASVTVPRQARFEPPSFGSLEDHDDEEDIDEESFVVPSTPVLNKPASAYRKRRHVNLQLVNELKGELERHRKRSAGRPNQLHTAKLYLRLGTTEQKAHLYPAAINSFFQAAAIYRHFSRRAALATALDNAAVAYCHAHEEGATIPIHSQHKVSRFYRCLSEALDLRKQELGPWHVDTVDTLQHLAHLCLLTGHAARAAGHYLEVVHLRKAIFGPHHPGTSVAAHCLGNAYLQSHDTVAAEVWYDHALSVYNYMQLPSDNPAVAKLLRDRKRLERVGRWCEEDPAEDENLLFDL